MSLTVLNKIWESSEIHSPSGKHRITPTECLVLLQLADNANHEGHCVYCSLRRLARTTKMQRKSVVRIIDRLEGLGAITVKRVPGGRRLERNSYTIKLGLFEGGKLSTTGVRGTPVEVSGGHLLEVSGGHHIPSTSPKNKPHTHTWVGGCVEKPGSPDEVAAVLSVMMSYTQKCNAKSAQGMLARCRQVNPEVQIEDICRAINEKACEANGSIGNLTGWLLTIVPPTVQAELLAARELAQQAEAKLARDGEP